jgi:DNA-binding winged helix-turn-helix (wHTH) protein
MPSLARSAESFFPGGKSLEFSGGFLGFSQGVRGTARSPAEILRVGVRLAFGDCTLDSETRELFRKERPAHLSPKAFRLLELLLEGRPKAFSKEEIHAKIWPDAFVSEATLASLIAEIREAIGEDAKDARSIRTVHGFGYAFAGAASEVPRERRETSGPSSWRLIWDDRVIPVPEGETILGRDPLAGIRIPSESVSRRHARIVIARGAATIEDLDSKNGTYLRGARIAAPKTLKDGDSLRIASVTLTFRAVSEDKSTMTEIGTPPGEKVSAPARRPRKGKPAP